MTITSETYENQGAIMDAFMKYPKIPSLYKREIFSNEIKDSRRQRKHSPLIKGDWSDPIFEYLSKNQWTFQEKIDGTNIRIMFSYSPNKNEDTETTPKIRIGGRTDNSQIPTELLDYLMSTFTVEKFESVFDIENYSDSENIPESNNSIILFGEGCGKGIQKGWERYGNTQHFRLFDVVMGRDLWLGREQVSDMARKFLVPSAPIIGKGTIEDACEFVSNLKTDSKTGVPEMEGIVIRPEVEMKTRRGNPVMAKVKFEDFREGR